MIKVGQKKIGGGRPVFIAAEIGINHNGDMALARKMIDAAAESGVDGVKFQNYYTEDFVLDRSLTHQYFSHGRKIVESQFKMFKRYELSREQLRLLKNYCEKKRVVFFSTPTSQKGIDDLMALGVRLLKNGSDFLVNLDVIERMAKTRLPLVLSTGMATMSEIKDAVKTFEHSGGKELVILHCTSSYPTPDTEVNLKKISSLKKAFDYPVGFSDHTWGNEAAFGAVVLGACFIEKHFTLKKTLPGPDHRFSSDPEEMGRLVAGVRKIERCLGTEKIGPTPSEEKGRLAFRLSCAAARDLKKWEPVRSGDLIYLRPASGLPPKSAQFIIGKTLKKPILKGEFFTLNHCI